jgi:CDP-diacylglycerol--glycerol-3-phosphate 3-phosphatidyltransferase
MVTAALILIVAQNPLWWFTVPVVVIICREIGVSALREWMADRQLRAEVKVGQLGKWKTAFQMVALAFLLEATVGDEDSRFSLTTLLHMSRPVVFHIGIVFLYVSAILSVVSGYQYFSAGWKQIVSKKH